MESPAPVGSPSPQEWVLIRCIILAWQKHLFGLRAGAATETESS